MGFERAPTQANIRFEWATRPASKSLRLFLECQNPLTCNWTFLARSVLVESHELAKGLRKEDIFGN